MTHYSTQEELLAGRFAEMRLRRAARLSTRSPRLGVLNLIRAYSSLPPEAKRSDTWSSRRRIDALNFETK
ncbi:MAG: hypothetical protein WDO70_01145 [Alphaproteobacteria bacterium]